MKLQRSMLVRAVLAAAVFAAAAGLAAATERHAVAAQAVSEARNLKVLPKTTSMADIYKVMAGMQRDLGVQCGFCHEEDQDTKQINYVSDENPRKETARFMMRMTADINTKYLGQLGDRQYAPPITCGNCHLAQMHPPVFEPAPSR